MIDREVLKTKILQTKRYLQDHPKKSLGLAAIVFLTAFLYFYLISPTIFLYQKSKTLPFAIKPIRNALSRQDVETLEFELKYFRTQLTEINENAAKINLFSFVPFFGNYPADLKRATAVSLEAFDALIELSGILKPYLPTLAFAGWGAAVNNTNPNASLVSFSQALPKISQDLEKFKDRLISIDQKIQQINENKYPSSLKGIKIRDNIESLKQLSSLFVSHFDELNHFLKISPEVIGAGADKNYLLIFQNDKQLRPTGGFITAYGVISLRDGRVKVSKSGDIYFLDEKVVRRTPAPNSLARYTGSSVLYIRNANYSPDFATTAQTIYDLWGKTPGSFPLDGLIAVDSHFFETMLHRLGEVATDKEKQKKVTAEKITEELQSFSRFIGSRSPESRQQKDFMAIVLNEMLKKIFAADSSTWGEIVNSLFKEIAEKHLLLNFKNDQVQELAESLQATGKIKEFGADYLHINEANFSGDRANWFLKEKVVKTVAKEKDKWVSHLTIDFENTADYQEFFNTGYKALVRVFVPQGSKLLSSQGSSETVVTGEDLGKTYFAAFVKVEPKGKTSLNFKYELPNLNFDQGYELLIQKQPGQDKTSYRVVFKEKAEEFDLNQDRVVKII